MSADSRQAGGVERPPLESSQCLLIRAVCWQGETEQRCSVARWDSVASRLSLLPGDLLADIHTEWEIPDLFFCTVALHECVA